MAKNNPYPYAYSETVNGKTYNYFRRGKGIRTRLPDDKGSPEFKIVYEEAYRNDAVLHVREMKVTPIERRKQRSERTIKGAFRSCRTRARQKGLAFNIDLDFLMEMAEAQEFRCALTGIEFFAKTDSSARVNPYTPSVDRIEPSQGYVKGNVRLVVYAMNAMLLDWGEDLFHQIANSYRYWSRTKKAQKRPDFFSIAPTELKNNG